MLNGSNDFFKATALKSDTVKVEGFGDLEVHEIRLGDRLSISEKLQGEKQDAYIAGIIMGCDLFTADDAEKLADVKSDVLLALFNRIMQLSGMMPEPAKKP